MNPDVAHILPYSMLNKPENTPGDDTPNFWKILRAFWGKDRVMDGEMRSFRIPNILILVLKLASISSVLTHLHTGCGIRDFLRLSL
jgi:hypothetical protein